MELPGGGSERVRRAGREPVVGRGRLTSVESGAERPRDARPDPASAEEAVLIDRAGRGRDHRAFEALFHRYRDDAYGLAARLAGDPVDAEEIVVEAFAAAWAGLPDFDGRSAFRTWLNAILLNRSRARGRAARRRRRRIVSVADPEGWERAVEASFPGTRIDIERAIAALPQRARETVLLRHASGLSYAEIADAMAVTLGTVKSQLARAYELMRERLSDD